MDYHLAQINIGRLVAPIDDPPDRLYGLIVHELTHQFEFDIIPQGLIRRSVPLWVNEGLSDYERGQWEPLDLMAVRDAVLLSTGLDNGVHRSSRS